MSRHAFLEAAHASQEKCTLVHAWRAEGSQPVLSTTAAWDHMTRTSPVLFQLPFDERGRPTLPERQPTLPWSRGAPLDEEERRVRGRIAATSGGPAPGVVFRELWVTRPPIFRVSEGVDFLLEDEHGELARCYLMGIPLVVAPPTTCTVGEHLATIGARARELVGAIARGRDGETARLIEVRERTVVDVVGAVRKNPRGSDAPAIVGPYRSATAEPPYLIGRVPLSRLHLTVTPP